MFILWFNLSSSKINVKSSICWWSCWMTISLYIWQNKEINLECKYILISQNKFSTFIYIHSWGWGRGEKWKFFKMKKLLLSLCKQLQWKDKCIVDLLFIRRLWSKKPKKGKLLNSNQYQERSNQNWLWHITDYKIRGKLLFKKIISVCKSYRYWVLTFSLSLPGNNRNEPNQKIFKDRLISIYYHYYCNHTNTTVKLEMHSKKSYVKVQLALNIYEINPFFFFSGVQKLWQIII